MSAMVPPVVLGANMLLLADTDGIKTELVIARWCCMGKLLPLCSSDMPSREGRLWKVGPSNV